MWKESEEKNRSKGETQETTEEITKAMDVTVSLYLKGQVLENTAIF